jgi:hypothetical protein
MYNGYGYVVFFTDEIEVGEEEEDEVVIGADKTCPCGYML